jgi:hypothetical protein
MRKFFKLGVPAATFVVAATLGAMNTNPAHAGEYCRTDVSGHMTGCGFNTMEQCQAASSGIGGDCFRDPSLPAGTGNSASNANSLGKVSRNALAYQPRGLVRCIAGDTGTQRTQIERLQHASNAVVMTKRSARRRCVSFGGSIQVSPRLENCGPCRGPWIRMPRTPV